MNDVYNFVQFHWKPGIFTVEIVTLLTIFDSPVYHED